MKILFIENREKTLFWEQIALNLASQGHEIAWLVQNPLFRPKLSANNANTYLLPFPERGATSPPCDVEAWVRANHPRLVTDRGRTFFGAGTAHYDHYKAAISHALADARPDIVIGESTLFHELLAIDLCEELGYPYVQPVSNRYPQGRFSLFSSDTQLPVIESGDRWTDDQARDLAHRIATSTEIPFYMVPPSAHRRIQRRVAWGVARANVWRGRLQGEHYNTPSLSAKLALQSRLRRNLQRWTSLQSRPKHTAKTVLYPLQLQPEANIDVWGKPYSDQLRIIREMIDAAPRGFQIAIKVNPKAKYEVSDALIGLAASDDRVCLLPLEMKMPEAIASSIGAVTITGTIGLEAICGKGRAISIKHPIVESAFPNFFAPTPAAALTRLVNEPTAGVGGLEAGAKLINLLVRQSFPGLVADPVGYPAVVEPLNIRRVAEAIGRLAGLKETQQ